MFRRSVVSVINLPQVIVRTIVVKSCEGDLVAGNGGIEIGLDR